MSASALDVGEWSYGSLYTAKIMYIVHLDSVRLTEPWPTGLLSIPQIITLILSHVLMMLTE
jgi:hypothetical protein